MKHKSSCPVAHAERGDWAASIPAECNCEKRTNYCLHDFKYSHKEARQVSTVGTAAFMVDVVVCAKCGLTKRYEI